MKRTHYKVKAEQARKSWMHLKKELRRNSKPETENRLENGNPETLEYQV